MRKLAILLVLAVPVVAQDDAASLFYKGFWLEQAEGKLDEAAALYAQLLKEKPDAPEAPRALLGLVRIKVARNEDPKELVAELERRYPGAKEEIEAGRRAAPARARGFADPIKDSDSGVEVKIKILYMAKLNGLAEEDRVFLIDLGSVAHPMLAVLLRGTSPEGVKQATQVLLLQRTPEADALVARALLDDAAVFRAVIVEALRNCGSAPLVLVEALAKLYDGAPPRLRAEVVRRLASMAAREGDGRDRAFAVLMRALEDDDAAVRTAALVLTGAPDAYVDALLRRLEAKDPAMGIACPHLSRLADRPAFRERLEALLDGCALNWRRLPEVPHEEGALLLARRVARELKQGNRDDGVYNLAYMCAGNSPKAAAELLVTALELNDPNLVSYVEGGMGKRDCVLYLGDQVPSLRAAALASARGLEESGHGAAEAVIALLGLGPADFQVVVDTLRRGRDRGIPALLLDRGRLDTLGPAKAAALVEFCRDEKDALRLLRAGRFFAGRDDAGEFFRMVLARAGPSAATEIGELAKYPALAPLVAERLVSAAGPEWGWVTAPPRPDPNLPVEKYPGPFAWRCLYVHSDLFATPPLRALLVPHVDDPRFEIAVAAASAAASDKTEAGTEALGKSLQSKWPDVRAIALLGLAARVTDAPALVREFAKRPDLTPEDRAWVGLVILEAKNPAMTAVAADLLGEDVAWDGLWDVFHELDPKAAVEDALAARPTVGSLGVLVRSQDPRRIEIFRSVLKGTDTGVIHTVLRAVYDQYLVELGEETLAQLRNPDDSVRGMAGSAIERLKFYAEAKKAFQK